MLAKFKMSLVEGPAAVEKRQQRQAIAAARAARAVQREEARLLQYVGLPRRACLFVRGSKMTGCDGFGRTVVKSALFPFLRASIWRCS